jgi:hypothetical protein
LLTAGGFGTPWATALAGARTAACDFAAATLAGLGAAAFAGRALGRATTGAEAFGLAIFLADFACVW